MSSNTDTEKTEVQYITMLTVRRVNYRTACDFKTESIAGVLEANTTVSVVVEDYFVFSHGRFWRKVKVGRKHFYVVDEYLKSF